MIDPNEAVPEHTSSLARDRIAQAYFGLVGTPEFRRRTCDRIHWLVGTAAGAKVLDIGCSEGILAILLARDGFEVTGVDVNPEALTYAQGLLTKENDFVQNRVTFIHADLLSSELKPEAFDTVVCGEVVEHLTRPESMIQSAFLYLKPGGTFLLTTPFGYHPDPDHRQTFTLSRVIELLKPYCAPEHIAIEDNYIRFVGTKKDYSPESWTCFDEEVLLSITEKSAIAQQKFLHEQVHAWISSEREARNKVKELQKELAVLKEFKKGMAGSQKELAALKEAKHGLTLACNHLTHANNELQDKLEQKIQDRELVVSNLKRCRKDLEEIKGSIAYNLGFAFTQAVLRPGRNTLALPVRLIRLVLRIIRGIKGKEFNKNLLNMYNSKGPEAVIQLIKKETIRGSKEQASELLKVARDLFEQGVEDAELQLAGAALELDRSAGTLRGFAWAAQRANQLEAACDAILEIEELLESFPSKGEQKRLAQLKRSPAYQLSLLRMIESPKERVIEPIAKRICYILHNSLPYSSGGYATRSHGVATGLAAQDYEVIILTRPGFPVDIKDELEPSEVSKSDSIDDIKYVRILQPTPTRKSVPQYVSLSADELEAKFREYRPEIVIAASNFRVGLMALIAARRLGIPFIYEVRGWWEITRMSRDIEFESTPAFVVQTLLETATANHADHVFTLTEPMREELVRRGVEADKISLLPNSCDPERFRPRERDEILGARLGIPGGVPVIGYVGTFVDYEGLEDLAEACALLKQKGVKFRLLLVGNENTSGKDRGPITAQILKVAKRDGFGEWLIMPGRVSHEEVDSYYSLIDIAPFPRKAWPVCEMVSPMKPLEALAMEKAVVVSSVRALCDMIQDGKTGLIFEKNNIDSLADTLSKLIDFPELRVKLGKEGRQWVVRERTWRQIGEKAAAKFPS